MNIFNVLAANNNSTLFSEYLDTFLKDYFVFIKDNIFAVIVAVFSSAMTLYFLLPTIIKKVLNLFSCIPEEDRYYDPDDPDTYW